MTEYPPREFRHSHEFDDEDMDRIRRYEDFTTIDWIEDSMLERNRRLREERQAELAAGSLERQTNLQRIWLRTRKLMIDMQGWLVISIAGAAIGVNAALISIITEWLSDLKLGYCSDGWWLNRQFCCWEIDDTEETGAGCETWHSWSPTELGKWFFYVLFALVFSFVAAHLVRAFARYAAGSGISEIKVILTGFIMQGYLGAWTLAIKSITLVVAFNLYSNFNFDVEPFVIASGLSVGKEGPSVHVACCIGNVVARLFGSYSRSQVKLREILTAASAAGVAVAFGSPIGGVLFSIEEMSHTFSVRTMWRSFLCALVATVTLSAMNPFRTGKLVLFQVTYDRDWHFFEIIFFVIIGIFGGLYGALVIKCNIQIMAFRRKYLSKHGRLEAVTLATLTAMFGYFNRFLRIDMTESMAVLFRECEDGGDYQNLCQTFAQWRMANSLFIATVFRIGFVIISYGCQVPCGIFVPSMAIGATFGRMLGIIVKAIYRNNTQAGWFAVCKPDVPCITPGTYAFLGAAAALGGVMRITVTVVVIMFELTGALTYILPTMIVLLVTKAVGDFFVKRGIADEMIRFNGYPYLDKEDHAFNVTVAEVMRKDLQTLPSNCITISDLESRIEDDRVSGYPIVSGDNQKTLQGYIGRTELLYVIEKYRRQDISGDTECSFLDGGHAALEQSGDLPAVPSGPILGLEEAETTEVIESATRDNAVRLRPWVNQTPVTVAPQLPLEIAMQMFRRLGPKVILVEERGQLCGLLTVKDVLRYTAREHKDGGEWQDNPDLADMLGEAWTWITASVSRLVDRTLSYLRL